MGVLCVAKFGNLCFSELVNIHTITLESTGDGVKKERKEKTTTTIIKI